MFNTFGSFLQSIPIYQLLSGNVVSYLLTELYLLPAFAIGLSFHEAAHAWMANRMGDPTARNLGRMTLDPTKHIDLFGILSFLVIGFGWGKPVPTNPRNYYNYKKGNILVALSGVTMNLAISFVSYAILFILLFGFGVTNQIVIQIVGNIVIMNIVLCVFNLIPIPPLDGHHLISGFIARKSPKFYMLYMRYGQFVLLILVFATNFISYILNYAATGILYLYNLFFGLFI
jgi:Zn-dependent protease